MAIQDFKRKLAAILSADVKGYSLLMSEDEVETIQTLTTYRGLMAKLIQQHQGRVVDYPGDNLLAEFGSVVDSVQCAVEIQQELKAKNAKLPESRKMEFRIGINLGDVIVSGEQIYGAGVNIAARIEGLAEGGSIAISGTVYDQVKNKLSLVYEYLGEQDVKNISEPERVYRIRLETDAVVPGVSRGLKLPDKPSIAVLPFDNMSGDPEQGYFSDGITEDIITDLSKVSGLFVIARNSSYTYKGKAVKVEDVGRELGVKYVLEGSVRKANDRVRITAPLVDASTGGHLWAERYDRDLKDIFALQDEVTKKIVSALAVRLTEDECECKLCEYTCTIDSYDAYLQGLEHFNRLTEEANIQARQMFEKSIDLSPEFVPAYALLARSHLVEWSLGWSMDPQSLERAFQLGRRAIDLDDSTPEAHRVLGCVYLWKKQHKQAIDELEKAIALDPNSADGYDSLGDILSWAGRPKEAIEQTKKAMRLNPIYPPYYLWHLGHAYFLTGQYEEAITAFKKALDRNPKFWPPYAYLAAICGEQGREEEALAEVAEVLKFSPSFSLETWCQRLPYQDPAVTERTLNALRNAGLR
jgi:adenylate cyclase